MSDSSHEILDRPWTYCVVELHIDLVSRQLEMTLCRAGEWVRLRFTEVQQLAIDEGYTGTESGMEILDLCSAGMESVRVRVSSFEPDPAIRFFAKAVERIPIPGRDVEGAEADGTRTAARS